MEWKCEFYDTENLDGYFSGVLYLYTNNKRYIFSFGYDIEFETITSREEFKGYIKAMKMNSGAMKV